MAGGPGIFTTWMVLPHPEHGFLHQTSRRHRKTCAAAIHLDAPLHPHDAVGKTGHQWLRFWAPHSLSWWIAVLFMVGSMHFALASAAALWPLAIGLAQIPPQSLGAVYFCGSLFFTSAAALQWLQALNRPLEEQSMLPGAPKAKWRFHGWNRKNLGFLSATSQLIGTVLFNFNTADALLQNLSWQEQDLLIWTPDFLGSICFMIAGQLALMEYSHSAFCFKPKDVSWWIVSINGLGCLLFMVSALTSFFSPSHLFNIPWMANAGTLGGALCFFVAAYLLIPEFFEKQVEVDI